MGDTAWKKHERIVATYFGVTRGKRGDDFSQIGCEVVAPLDAWDNHSRSCPKVGQTIFSGGYSGVIVECKQGYSSKPMTLLRDAHRRNPDSKSKITLVIWGEYAMTWMEDREGNRIFDQVWNDLIAGEITTQQFIRDYYVEWVSHQVPKYLKDFHAQSKDYCRTAEEELGGRVKALVALHAKGMQGRCIVWRMR